MIQTQFIEHSASQEETQSCFPSLPLVMNTGNCSHIWLNCHLDLFNLFEQNLEILRYWNWSGALFASEIQILDFKNIVTNNMQGCTLILLVDHFTFCSSKYRTVHRVHLLWWGFEDDSWIINKIDGIASLYDTALCLMWWVPPLRPGYRVAISFTSRTHCYISLRQLAAGIINIIFLIITSSIVSQHSIWSQQYLLLSRLQLTLSSVNLRRLA